LIDNQTISPQYTNSAGQPVVAFGFSEWFQDSANSNYNSLQVSLERRAADINFLLAYTYAKSLDGASAAPDPYPGEAGRSHGLSSWDMRQNFVASYSWAVPFQRFLGHNRLSEGWNITGISRFNTGFPINMSSTGDFALTNVGLDYPSPIAPLKKLNPHAAGHYYFSPSSFASGLSCGYEVCGVTGSEKQYAFSGPGTINTDAGVEKNTRIREGMSFNLRLEMFNVFNHANFTSVTGNANSGQFGQATNTAPGRIGQVSGKFIF
jgi:hypothetical protein